jgi:SET domain
MAYGSATTDFLKRYAIFTAFGFWGVLVCQSTFGDTAKTADAIKPLVHVASMPVASTPASGTVSASENASATGFPSAKSNIPIAGQAATADGTASRPEAEHADKGDGWEDAKTLLAAASIVVGLFALSFSAYTRWRTANQAYYAHLSKIWYDLRKTETDRPEWLDPEFTTLYGLNEETASPDNRTAYDAHAWSSWALAEDWYETFGRKARNDELPKQRDRFRNELSQFQGAIHGITELHWAWLSVPRNYCRFDPKFIRWIRKNFLESRFKTSTTNVVEGSGIVALQDILSGQFIGFMEGDAKSTATKHTLRVTESVHIVVTSDLQFLNHSDNPNAVIRGRAAFALKDIPKDAEITINYNCTEDEFKINRVQMGYIHLSDEQRKKLNPFVHRWIRIREDLKRQLDVDKAPISFRIRMSADVQGMLSDPVEAGYVRQRMNAAGLKVDGLRFLPPTDTLNQFGKHLMEVRQGGTTGYWTLELEEYLEKKI